MRGGHFRVEAEGPLLGAGARGRFEVAERGGRGARGPDTDGLAVSILIFAGTGSSDADDDDDDEEEEEEEDGDNGDVLAAVRVGHGGRVRVPS